MSPAPVPPILHSFMDTLSAAAALARPPGLRAGAKGQAECRGRGLDGGRHGDGTH